MLAKALLAVAQPFSLVLDRINLKTETLENSGPISPFVVFKQAATTTPTPECVVLLDFQGHLKAFGVLQSASPLQFEGMMIGVLHLAGDEEILLFLGPEKKLLNLNPKQLYVRERKKAQRPDFPEVDLPVAFLSGLDIEQFCCTASRAPVMKMGCCVAFYV